MAKALKKAERAASCLKGHKFVEVSSFGDLRFGTCKKCGSKMWGSKKETEDGEDKWVYITGQPFKMTKEDKKLINTNEKK